MGYRSNIADVLSRLFDFIESLHWRPWWQTLLLMLIFNAILWLIFGAIAIILINALFGTTVIPLTVGKAFLAGMVLSLIHGTFPINVHIYTYSMSLSQLDVRL